MSLLLSAMTSLCLVLSFAILAALSTVSIWALLSLFTAEPFAIDAMGYWPMTVGAVGPILVLLLVHQATKATATSKKRKLRMTGAIGSFAVLIIEAIYLVLLGIVYWAYKGVQM